MKMNEISFNTFEPLWLKVYKPVRERILKGYLLPGAMLSENELADEFQVSRTPVREAVRLLINDGLVGVSPGRKMRIISLRIFMRCMTYAALSKKRQSEGYLTIKNLTQS